MLPKDLGKEGRHIFRDGMTSPHLHDLLKEVYEKINEIITEASLTADPLEIEE